MREAVYVDVNQGDVKTVVDFRAPFLSVCGTAVSTDAASLEALQQRHLNRNYRLPFWISNSEATFLLNFPYVKRALSIDHTLFERRSHLFANDAVAVSVLDGGASKRVVNLEELTRKDMDFETTIRYCFYFFRLFEPINVATRQPFDKYVTNRIRLESVMSKCWCSIWGTAEDYAAAGIPLRDDPLDLVAVDLFGNELTLISAMGTVSPQDCFSQVYPSKAIFE
ncbi:hypothetical protein AGDE_11149 [Angomonas deanei]|uniref:Uncharacterized protein n=1 Tax=Angomonas deanei TaxID=59799 RepID=S9VQ70_9TRYP|nr:hypothetical protein AGDE_11827 [Angomonas deanei]EPY26674.1 hypothetical protein AGDE_11149 [Angomonas deanei]CAD2213451.1 hypothetical protein, conserved [Angomonas deanei]|eukprot:EPY25380.1 hypothetical protein AGDE_11827 [Angomonas deanei]